MTPFLTFLAGLMVASIAIAIYRSAPSATSPAEVEQAPPGQPRTAPGGATTLDTRHEMAGE